MNAKGLSYNGFPLYRICIFILIIMNSGNGTSDPGTSDDGNENPATTTEPLAIPIGRPASLLQCSSTVDQNFKFVLSARLNRTGHWLADMEVQHGAGPGTTANERNPVEVRLEHRTTACAEGEAATEGDAAAGNSHAAGRVSIVEPPAVRAPTAGGYRFYPGFGFYKRHTARRGWHEAQGVCRAEGGDLVVIDSPEEAQVLLELSAPLLFLQPAAEWNREAWVGASDTSHEGNFVTVRGDLLKDTGYEEWSPKEPNNFSEEDCVTIVRNGMFNDMGCDKEYEFICEVEA